MVRSRNGPAPRLGTWNAFFGAALLGLLGVAVEDARGQYAPPTASQGNPPAASPGRYGAPTPADARYPLHRLPIADGATATYARSTNGPPVHQTSPLNSPTNAPTNHASNGPAYGRATPSQGPVLSPWQHDLNRPMLRQNYAVPLTLDQLTVDALHYSLRLRVTGLQPRIDEEAVARAAAAFDWNAFITSRWQDQNQPSSTSLVTGGPFVFQDQSLRNELGVQRQNAIGGALTVGQSLNFQNTNSTFFNPPHQGATTLRLNYSQPLLRGAGQFYNRSLIVVAELRGEASRQTSLQQLQDHLLQVHQAYWELYFARGQWTQQLRLLAQAETLVAKLKARENVDGAKDQILRAETSAAERNSTLVRAQKQVLDAQARLRLLVNSPAVQDCHGAEFVTSNLPILAPAPVALDDAFATAMQFRPEIGVSLARIRDARVRMNVAENELLPSLNLVVESYLNGLRGESDVGGAFRDQFGTIAPSYVVGLELRTPIGNRVAKSNQRRTSLEAAQLQSQFQLVTEQIWQEVAGALRELDTSYREMLLTQETARRTQAQLEYFEDRRELIPLKERTASLFLEDVLRVQERLVDAELAFLRSQITYTQAVVGLKRAMGYLLYEERSQ